ncbi:MAG TPA: CDP-alcohol phosphatidyltransferase family protein [Candidatus Saccharimonadales bacterium]|nr:CDP-alcohol phosphatidyltransferase family protein [Candidatus Saccharimonadales bacterium]
MKTVVQGIKNHVRTGMRTVARGLNAISGGRVTPNGVTIFGTLMHIPIAFLIATDHFMWAAAGLLVFGLFDTLDGELARLQNKSSVKGMLLDASTDRLKEAMLYTGIAYVLATGPNPETAAWAAAAVGASISVSYVKAKGEAAVASSKKEIPHHTLNRMFADGILTFEIRMFILLVALLVDQLMVATAIVAIGATYTVLQRLVRISGKL